MVSLILERSFFFFFFLNLLSFVGNDYSTINLGLTWMKLREECK